MADTNAYLSVDQVARRFGITTSTVYRLAQRGILPGFKVGVQWRFSPDMLESWVADQVTLERLRAEDRRGSSDGRPADE
jgi:excisionase family DNA binding protein